jgi:hypothetical protein
MAIEYSSFAGWEKNLRFSNRLVEAIITLEAGPRIISFKPLEGRSVFKLVSEEAGKSEEGEWKIRGGHRLWTAPEDFGQANSLCYALDNSTVEHEIVDEFTARVSNVIQRPSRLRREMIVKLGQTTPKITVQHRIAHEGGGPLEVAPWGLTVMAAGGFAVLPQPALGTHPEDYLPNRAIVAWPFTDLSDERFYLGRSLISLRQTDRSPFKIGLRHAEGWAGYVLGDHLFLKSVPFIEGENYPDFGSNFETFTNAAFLELETLGPLKRLSEGEALTHTESWVVFSNVSLPEVRDDQAFLAALEPYTAQLLRD